MISKTSWKNYLRVKDNLSVILLIPTLLGGLWQLLELSRISTSFVRFFSVSQLIPDGLLIAFFIFCFWLVLRLMNMHSISESINNAIERDVSNTNKKDFIIILIILIIGVGELVWSKDAILEIILSKSIRPGILYKVGPSLIGLYLVVTSIIVLFKIAHYRVKNKYLSIGMKFIKVIGVVSVCISAFIVFIFVLFCFHKTFTFPENLENENYLNCIAQKRHKSKYEILYFNDKYVFVEFIERDSISTIEVFNFETLLDANACDSIP